MRHGNCLKGILCFKSGDAPPIEADERFDKTHDSLVQLLTSQSAVYDGEEHALRVLMEEEVAEKMASSSRDQGGQIATVKYI